MRVSELNIYPIKSCGGISLAEAVINERGLECDRRWVIVDEHGNFLTQREWPRMALVKVERTADGLLLTGNGAGTLPIEPLSEGPRVETQVWSRSGEAIAYDAATNEWFGKVLGREVELRYMPADASRDVKYVASEATDRLGFADAYPLLLANEASLDALSSRMGTALPMDRFRPNIVVSGGEPWAEDSWARIRVGQAVFRVAKPSDRCVLTTVDQAKGVSGGKEPLKTLATFRQSKDVFPDRYQTWELPANSVLFGENLIPDTPGVTIRVGDEVEVLERR